MKEYCEVKVRGDLGPHWSDWFSGLKLVHLKGNVSVLSGLLPDQPAIFGVLERIRDLNLALISVRCDRPSDARTARKAGNGRARPPRNGISPPKSARSGKTRKRIRKP